MFLGRGEQQMYDFFLGDAPRSLEEEIRFLVSIKRLLPRWTNSVPDAEFTAICELLAEQGARVTAPGRRLVLVETGAGATTVALAYYAMKHGGVAYTWDTNAEKGSELRRACCETIAMVIDRNINAHWKLVAYDSLSPYLGLPVLDELVDHVDFFFHDSHHVFDTAVGELAAVHPFLADGGIVALDDAYYDFRHTDTAYINIVRKKLGLGPVAELPDNRGEPLYRAAERWLRERWTRVEPVTARYRATCGDDVSIAYFGDELQVRSDLGMERVKHLENRFAAWRLDGKRG